MEQNLSLQATIDSRSFQKTALPGLPMSASYIGALVLENPHLEADRLEPYFIFPTGYIDEALQTIQATYS